VEVKTSCSVNLPSRRVFLGVAGSVAAVHGVFAQSELHGEQPTAQQVIDRIRQHVGIPWRATTVDTVKAGNPSTRVTGIATTMVATLDVLKRASAAGRNMIVVHEPTFYSSLEDEAHAPGNAEDPLFQFKKNFIETNNLVVWRFHDHWHGRKPDGIITGMAIALGWDKYQVPDNPRLYTLPQTSLVNLAKGIRDRLKLRAVRVVGDPQTMVSKAAFNPGSTGLAQVERYFSGPDVDVFVCGEPREWDAGLIARG
jgi:hypothetical protein